MGAFGSGLGGGLGQMGQLMAAKQWNDLAQQMQSKNQEAMGKQLVSGAQAAPNFSVQPDQIANIQMQDLRSRMLFPMMQRLGGGMF